MKKAIEERAVKVIDMGIKFYQKELMRHLELKSEYDLQNGNLIATQGQIQKCNPEKYLVIIADLLAIKRAIQNEKEEVKLYVRVDSKEDYYVETSGVLNKIKKLDFYAKEPGILKISVRD